MTYYHLSPRDGTLQPCGENACSIPHAEHFVKGTSTILPMEQAGMHQLNNWDLPRSTTLRSVIHAHERVTEIEVTVGEHLYRAVKAHREDLTEGDLVIDQHMQTLWTAVPSPAGLVLANGAIPHFTLPTTGPMALAPAFVVVEVLPKPIA